MSITKLDKNTLLEVKGPDAITFLQGQLSQDISSLKIGDAKWFGLSNAKGRLLAVGQIFRSGDDQYWLVLPRGIAESIQAILLRYKFRSKVEFTRRDDLNIYASWGDNDVESQHQYNLLAETDHRILISEDLIETNESEEAWTEQKILNGLPDVFPETQERFVAQMLNLDLIDGISFSKGCYTGQEIIARMQHLGRIKRRMLALELDEELQLGEKWEIAGQKLGEVVNVVKSDGKYLALVCVQLDKMKGNPISFEFQYSLPEMITN